MRIKPNSRLALLLAVLMLFPSCEPVTTITIVCAIVTAAAATCTIIAFLERDDLVVDFGNGTIQRKKLTEHERVVVLNTKKANLLVDGRVRMVDVQVGH